MRELIALSMLVPVMLLTLWLLQQPLLFVFQLGILLPLILFHCARWAVDYYQSKVAIKTLS